MMMATATATATATVTVTGKRSKANNANSRDFPLYGRIPKHISWTGKCNCISA